MTDAYSLLDFQKAAKTDLEATVIQTWRETSPIMDMLKFKEKKALEVEYLRTKTLNEIPWRAYNDAFTDLKVQTEPVHERPHFLGAKIDIPKALVVADSLFDIRKQQEKAQVEGLAKSFNYAFVNGDPTSDANSLIGLRYRFQNALDAGQTVDGGDLDISPNTAVTTWITQFFDLIEDLRSRCQGGDCDVLLMNRTTKLRLESAMRSSGLKSTTEDKTGKSYPSYGEGGPRIIDVGYKADDSTMIMPDTETEGAITGGAESSIMAVKFGEPYVIGFYEYPINVKDKGILEDEITYRTVVEWSPGIAMVHPRSAAWLNDLVVA
jgi:hypothetical protein